MNSTGCGHLQATDEVLLYSPENAGSCNVSFLAWIILAVICVSIEIATAGVLVGLWLRKYKDMNAKATNHKEIRLPVVPALAIASLVANVLYWILPGLNLVSTGHAAPFIMFINLPTVILWIILLLRFVRLGLGATPRLNKWTVNAKSAHERSRLKEMDPLGRVLFGPSILCLFGSMLCFGIISPVLKNDSRPFLAGVGLFATMVVLLHVFTSFQIRRLQRTIKDLLDGDNAGLIGAEEARREFRTVYKRLNLQLVVSMAINIPFGTIGVLLVSRVISATFWLIGIICLMEAVGLFLFCMSNFVRAKTTKHSTDNVALSSKAIPSGTNNFEDRVLAAHYPPQ